MKRFFALLILIGVANAIDAQPARDSIIAVVNNLFEAMKRADTVLLKNCFSPNSVLQTIQENKGTVKVNNESIADFIAFVGKETVGAADEKIAFELIKIDGALATVWTPYTFYYKTLLSNYQSNKINCLA